ncbi:PREDICTED: uncharacterized protein LOC106323835 [Brassica oleracea var. oleracea]|uniref:uncharacterized protein LOC106323835 n=1 Tax=Brassica oleracea var. oleracea TaxID=109376 RepID=UPI0006A6BD4A|nr:PREDICTED: uncharacterized protein LOC106323835 [Brassica oleracea var. oleracea]
MDKALMALSLEEEDEPFDMPDLPQYKSCERNSRSIIGRILNPDCQKMPGLIREMPRTWQKQGKVRGIALSKERFQFVFDHEHDLLEVLEKGVHTFNDWTLAIDRWVEKPPEDYLQFIPLWVQIRNLPVNYYTKEAITALGEKIGAVKVVAFDPDKPQVQDYVRIQVRFDVSRPLRKSKFVNLPEGGSAVVLFNYERIRKRCYECQRLNHGKDICPLLNRNREAAALRSKRVIMDSHRNEVILHQDDPLFGVLSEDQVGICKMTGRRKIAPEVLEEMRRYLLMATEEDKKIRIDRVRSSVAEAEKDPFLQKTMLRLETAPTFTNQIDKGKGIVYDFDLNTSAEPRLEDKDSADKLMASAIKANIAGSLVHRWEDLRVSDRKADLGSIVHQAFLPHEPSSSKVSERGHDSTASLHHAFVYPSQRLFLTSLST